MVQGLCSASRRVHAISTGHGAIWHGWAVVELAYVLLDLLLEVHDRDRREGEERRRGQGEL